MQETNSKEQVREQSIPMYIPLYDKRGRVSICELVQVCRNTGKAMTQLPGFPQPLFVTKTCVRYRSAEVLAWLEGHKGQVHEMKNKE